MQECPKSLQADYATGQSALEVLRWTQGCGERPCGGYPGLAVSDGAVIGGDLANGPS